MSDGERQRRARGRGGIFLVRKGVWRVDVERPREPDAARRRRVSRTVHGSRKDVERQLEALLSTHEPIPATIVLRARVSTEVAEAVRRSARSEEISTSDWLLRAIDHQLARVGKRQRT